jgi:hypothetical protein
LFGHEVKSAYKFEGVMVQQLVCKPEFPWGGVVCKHYAQQHSRHAQIATDLRPAMLPYNIYGQGLVWRIGEQVALVRFAFLSKVKFSGHQLGMIAKSLGISILRVSTTSSVDHAGACARAIASQALPDLDVIARLSLVRAIVEPISMARMDPVLALALEELSKDNPSYKGFADLHDSVKEQQVEAPSDEHAARRANAQGPVTQVADLAYRATLSSRQTQLFYNQVC